MDPRDRQARSTYCRTGAQVVPSSAEDCLFMRFPRYYTLDGKLFSGHYTPDGWPIPHVSQRPGWHQIVAKEERWDRWIPVVMVSGVVILVLALLALVGVFR